MKNTLAVLGGCLLALMPIIVLAVTVYTMMLPNIYQSQARISVQEDAPSIDPFAAQNGEFAAYNPYFLKTQFEIIQSKPVLYEVISRLSLQQEWGSEGNMLPRNVALRILQNSIQVMQQRDTSLIIISVKRDNPDEAADIANELAQTYRDYRLDSAVADARGVIDSIEEAVKDQLKRVEVAEDRVERIREELGMPDGMGPDENQGVKYRPYRMALSDLETERFIFNQLKAKHRQAIITLEVPRNPVEIIDIAEPNRRPVSPNLFLNVMISVVVAALFGISGGIILGIGLRKSPPPIDSV